MFTGIVTAIGEVVAADAVEGGRHLALRVPWAADEVAIGASIALSGVCFTLASVDDAGLFHFHASPETLALTTVGAWAPGRKLNLERSLRLGDELGGHFVFGHVDAVGHVDAITPQGAGAVYAIAAPDALAPLIAVKGSIAVDGVSLTVTALEDSVFSLALIPHSLDATTLRFLRPGDAVNLEADMLARYVQRSVSSRAAAAPGA